METLQSWKIANNKSASRISPRSMLSSLLSPRTKIQFGRSYNATVYLSPTKKKSSMLFAMLMKLRSSKTNSTSSLKIITVKNWR